MFALEVKVEGMDKSVVVETAKFSGSLRPKKHYYSALKGVERVEIVNITPPPQAQTNHPRAALFEG